MRPGKRTGFYPRTRELMGELEELLRHPDTDDAGWVTDRAFPLVDRLLEPYRCNFADSDYSPEEHEAYPLIFRGYATLERHRQGGWTEYREHALAFADELERMLS